MTAAERAKRYRIKHADKCRAYAAAYRATHKKALPPPPTTKVCRGCLLDLTLTEFYVIRRVKGVRSHRGASGTESMCKACKSHAYNPALKAAREKTAELHRAGQRACNVCHLAKPVTDFPLRRASPDGLSYTCKVCARQRSARWIKAHPTAYSDWHQQNREHKRREWVRWSAENAGRHQENYRRWAAKNPERVSENRQRRVIGKLRGTPIWADKQAMRSFYAEAIRLTAETGIRHEVDHIVPIRSRVVCGLHVEYNLQVLTKTENLRKGNRHEVTAFPNSPA